MTAIVVAEKPSAARNMATALGGKTGTYKGTDYEIANLRGHLYEFKSPDKMVAPDLSEKYRKWDLENLPWSVEDLSWEREQRGQVSDVVKSLASALKRGDEIIVATDLDPSGEGDLLFWEAIDELGAHGKKFSRMEFTDESATSIQKAFEKRRPITSMNDEGDYRKALYRSQWDFLSLQFSRIATNMARRSGKDMVLRQGRLKSAMVSLVGDQLKAYNDYVKKPFFQNRFRDENSVVYTNPEESRFDAADQVPQQYDPSAVVLDGKAMKATAPPKLLDLAALSSMLVGKGVKAKTVLDTYQKMYEATLVSYPRTEDKTITPDQFKELAPLVDKIAAVVGVDTAYLTHREARKTHVKPQGAHGANRPGPKVPSSLDEVEQGYGKAGRLIYETLAKNYLAMIAEDYEYEQQKGHVEKYPDFKGVANVPKKQGWKAVFDPNAGEESEDENESSTGLGTNAEPFVFEGANKRPEHPSMKWLMKQLEKRDVGTGATRTSTYSEVTSTKTKFPLLVETGRKLTLAEAGELSWRLLPGTHIGDLGLTEKVYADMREIAEGKAVGADCLQIVADWVREDIATMTKNAATMRSELGLKEQTVAARAEGEWAAAPGGPKKVAFKKVFSGHEFSDAEIAKLLAGETIEFSATSKAGNAYTARGKLAVGEFKGRKFVGFQLERAEKPTSWCKHTFTEAEVKTLLGGGDVVRDDWVGKSGNAFSVRVTWDANKKQIEPHFEDVPRSFSGTNITDEQRAALERGEEILLKGIISKKSGRPYDAKLSWKNQGGKKKLVPNFG